ncbi:MAG: hypothetical protein JNJ54_04055 [Myxococcaceae bacterium]|nr:hypothetical protein [Myxococcaceae bacterium]
MPRVGTPARRVPVVFRYRGAPGRRVELFGDFPTWDRSRLMEEEGPGLYELTLELAPGRYRYKFLVDWRRWERDPDAQVDWTEGVDNSIVVVDGTHPPLHFACDRRHLQRTSDGVLRLHLESEAKARAPARVWAKVSGVLHWAPVVTRGHWRGRELLSCELALPRGATGEFGFEGWPEHVFHLPASAPATAEPPRWARSTVWYGIFLDRWHRRGEAADARVSDRATPTSATTFYGGDLDGVRHALPYLKALGVDGLVLTPVQPSETPHRYDTTDHHAIDGRLGGDAAFTKLVKAARRARLEVAADVSFTHVHEDHPRWRDVLKRQRRSASAKWFQVKRFPVRQGDLSTYAAYVDRPELPLLDLTHAPARAHVIEAAVRLVKLGADALRLDAMTDAPPVLWQELRLAVRKVRRDVLLLGEVVMDAQPLCARDLGADVLTDFQFREALVQLLRGRLTPAHFVGLTRFREFRQGPLPRSSRLRFIDNHDVSRLGSLVSVERVRLALTLLLLSPEPVWLTAGTEFDLAAGVPLFRLDDAWPERLPMPALDGPKPETHGLLTALLALRRRLVDDEVTLEAHEGLLSFERRTPDGHTIVVVLNLSDEPVTLERDGEVLLSVNEAAPRAAVLGPWAARVLEVAEGG